MTVSKGCVCPSLPLVDSGIVSRFQTCLVPHPSQGQNLVTPCAWGWASRAVDLVSLMAWPGTPQPACMQPTWKYQDPPGVLTLFEWLLFPLWFFKISCFIVIIKLKLSVSGVFSVFLQHYMYQTWMCVLQIHSLLLWWKKANYCKIQVSSLRRFAFATLRWPHCVRPPTPLRQPGSATQSCPTSSPFRCSDYMTTPIISSRKSPKQGNGQIMVR